MSVPGKRYTRNRRPNVETASDFNSASRDGGRLLLHPTAALTAFLAAAFILNIDGVKAFNIADVISASGAGSSLVNGDNFHQQILNQRHEPTKLMFSDVSATNYNIAILGAALIAQNLLRTCRPR